MYFAADPFLPAYFLSSAAHDKRTGDIHLFIEQDNVGIIALGENAFIGGAMRTASQRDAGRRVHAAHLTGHGSNLPGQRFPGSEQTEDFSVFQEQPALHKLAAGYQQGAASNPCFQFLFLFLFQPELPKPVPSSSSADSG
ncbi:MAG: hypothetical protein HFG27_03655 [Provencibacterium sp.]|nr:hypothetical protein [Provencibacterium sp.]